MPVAEEQSSTWTLTRVAILAGGGFAGFILILFLIALAIAVFGDVSIWAQRMQYFRDLLMIIVAVQVILIVTGFAILVVQIGRFVNLLRSEIKPITRETQQAARNVRVTSQFVSEQATGPVIQASSFFFGAITFLREISRIRSLLKKKPQAEKSDGLETATSDLAGDK